MADTAPQAVMDGSIHDAALAFQAMDDGLSEPSPSNTRTQIDRAPNGQFKGGRPQMAEVIDSVEMARPEALKPGDIMDAPAAKPGEADEVEASEPDDEFFEFEVVKDGKPVKERLKATEVWEQAQRAKVLEQELEQARKEFIPPEDYDRGMMQLIDAQRQALSELQVYEQMLTPAQPHPDLINPESPRYDPQLYHRQMVAAQHQTADLQQVRGRINAIQQEQTQRQEALLSLQRARGREALKQIWPEVTSSDGKEAARVRSEVADFYGRYGVTPEVMASITNPGFFAVLKDALAYRRGQKAQEAAVRVVRNKPKLVKGQARSTANPRAEQYQDGMRRLSQSNSVEDAAAAIAALG